MLRASRSNLLILGIVAQHMASKAICTAYSVANDYGISHVTARKELTTLAAVGLITKTDSPMSNGFHRVQYRVSSEGYHFLRDNLALYSDVYIEFLFSFFSWE